MTVNSCGLLELECIFQLKFTSEVKDLLVHYPVQAAKNTYIYIDIVVCHPVKDVVGEVLPGLIFTEHDEEGEESCEGGDDAEH